MQRLLLEKVEELTLYIIELHEHQSEMAQEIASLKTSEK
jgi:N-acetyl-gamma-glutamylphosphate reductase